MENRMRPNWEQGPRVVALGGGHGLSTMLRGLKSRTRDLTAIVTVADDGGGSGVLRQEMGMPPPGDIRICMQALANVEPVMEQLLAYRFTEGSLTGQAFGNLILAALNGISDSFDQAVEYINSNPGNTRLFIDGTVRITGGQKRITGECTFYGSNCNFVFDRDSSMVFSGQKVRFEDCIIYNETSFESQVENLLSLENASAEFKNCEISFVANENGAAIKSSGSAVVCRDTGITVQAGDGGCCIDSAVSVVRTDRCRLTVTSPSSCGIKVNNGQGIITGCTVYVSGNSGRGIEFINSKAAIQKCSITASLKDRTASSQAVYMDENTSTLLNDDLDVKGF